MWRAALFLVERAPPGNAAKAFVAARKAVISRRMNATPLTRPVAARDYDGVTAREFVAMWDDLDQTGHRFELDHGTIIRMAPPKIDHSDTQTDFVVMLASAVRTAATGLRVNVELGVVTGPDTVRVPDVVIRPPGNDEFDLVPPENARLVVEVADHSLLKDLGVKATDYAAAGIAEYWVVDVQARVVHMLRDPSATGYATRTVAPFGTPMRAACLPEPVVFEG